MKHRIVGVRLKTGGKTYWFNPGNKQLDVGTHVVVETIRGVEMGIVSLANKDVEEEEILNPLKDIIKVADENDVKHYEANISKSKETFEVAKEMIIRHGLDMKLINAEYTFDNNKILFYFTSDGRVDFRELVKDMASEFKSRIELRQVGVRDETKILGGLGACGRALCCSSFLNDFQPVSIKMAKEQGLSLNPTKISGMCGRLMCCLNYEQKAYEDALKRMPGLGSTIKSKDGECKVTKINLLKETMVAEYQSGNDVTRAEYKLSDITILKNTSKRAAKAKPPVEEKNITSD